MSVKASLHDASWAVVTLTSERRLAEVDNATWWLVLNMRVMQIDRLFYVDDAVAVLFCERLAFRHLY